MTVLLEGQRIAELAEKKLIMEGSQGSYDIGLDFLIVNL